jgi:hypothetical protein
MPEPAKIQFQREGDEISDTTSFSVLSLLGVVCSAVGLFAIGYVQVIPFAVVGMLIGAVVLITAKRQNISLLSKILGFLGIAMGATSASWGYSERYLATSSDINHAKQIAEYYLESLSAKELDKVYYLVGFQFSGEPNENGGTKETPEIQRAKTRLENDAAHLEIRNRKTKAKWVFVGLEGEIQGSVGHTYKLRYRDEGQTIPSEYHIYARKNCPKFSTQKKVHWFVDNLESVKK